MKKAYRIAAITALLCLCATSSWANNPWYVTGLLTYTPASPGVYHPVTFDWSAVTAEITRVTPCSWILKGITLMVFGPDGGPLVSRQGLHNCAQPVTCDASGDYIATLTITYATSIEVVDPGPGNGPAITHQCRTTVVVTVPKRAPFGVRISDLAYSLLPPNPIKVWGKVTGVSPVKISDGRAEITVTGLAASLGDFVVVTGDWNGTELALEIVSTPGQPTGSATPGLNISNMYSTTVATSSKNHEIEYSFNWGDGTSSPWSDSTSAWHAFSALGGNNVTVTARCRIHPDVSATSSTLPINVVGINSAAWECCDLASLKTLVGSLHDTGILSGDDVYAHMIAQIDQIKVYVDSDWLFDAGEMLADLELYVMDACISNQPPPAGILNTSEYPAGSALLSDMNCIAYDLGLWVP